MFDGVRAAHRHYPQSLGSARTCDLGTASASSQGFRRSGRWSPRLPWPVRCAAARSLGSGWCLSRALRARVASSTHQARGFPAGVLRPAELAQTSGLGERGWARRTTAVPLRSRPAGPGYDTPPSFMRSTASPGSASLAPALQRQGSCTTVRVGG